MSARDRGMSGHRDSANPEFAHGGSLAHVRNAGGFVGLVWTALLAESIREAVTTDPEDPMAMSLIGADRVFAYALLLAWVVCAGNRKSRPDDA
jgi:hypothetical protein